MAGSMFREIRVVDCTAGGYLAICEEFLETFYAELGGG
jgi:hypothetical protein